MAAGTFLSELKRRNVIRVGIFYAVGSWLVLQVADVLFGLIGVPDWSLRLVGGILLLGFPFALILAWAFELTPEGLKREKDIDRSGSATPETGRKLDVAILVMLVLTVATVAWDRLTPEPAEAPTVRPDTQQASPAGPAPASEEADDLSIAVLPFVNMSGDPENEYFSDGLSEEMLNVLARIEGFRVAGRTSSFAFKGKQEDLRAIGEKLDVGNILEGSVRKQGNQVRVTAQLIDARNGYHLWSGTYDRELDDVFAIQDEITTEVVRALKTTLLAEDQQVITTSARGDVEAYNHYLKGQFHARLRTRDGLSRALEEFQEAILVDPDYAPPYAGVAMVYALLDNYGYRSLSETKELAKKAIDRALELAPESDEAWAAKGLLLSQLDDPDTAVGETRAALERAIDINPNNALAHLWLSGTLFPDFQAIAAAEQRAYELDPLHPVIVRRQVNRALQSKDQPAIQRWTAELKAVAPDWYLTWESVAEVAIGQGRIADAALAMQRVVRLNPEYLNGIKTLAQNLALLGETDRARNLLEDAAGRFSRREVVEPLAVLEARRFVAQGDFSSAAAVYSRALSALENPEQEQVALLALLETGAGRAAEAEQSLRAYLGAEGEIDPSIVSFQNLLAWYALGSSLVAQGEGERAEPISKVVRFITDSLVEQGARLNFIPIVYAFIAYLEGDLAELAPRTEEAISQGFRMLPEEFSWLMPLAAGTPELTEAAGRMADVLAEERARYQAMQATEVAEN
ncbi:MAG: tetratricopeptide repeat protein [Gammaproteobacteria bacterium]